MLSIFKIVRWIKLIGFKFLGGCVNRVDAKRVLMDAFIIFLYI